MIEALIGALIGAVGFRLRGSALFEQWTGRGATTARIVCWAIPMSIVSLFAVPWYAAPLVGIAFFLGAIPGWYGCLDLGRDDGKVLRDYAVMLARGIVWTLPAALVYAWAGATPGMYAVALAGALCPLAYTIGWAIPSTKPNLSQGPELGEVVFGAMIGAAVVL